MGRLHRFILPLFSVLSSFASAQDVEARADDEHVGIRKFLSRPDIECASWKVTVYDEEAVSPGYWFVSPYEKNGYRGSGGSWIGPHIYDNDGELIWSGSHLFDRKNVMDFGVMNVGGEKLLSMSFADEQFGYLLDNQYKVKRKVLEGSDWENFNMHEFKTDNTGTRFLYLQRNTTHASKEHTMKDLGYDGTCHVTFPAFEERDVETDEVTFNWDASEHIPLSESTMAFDPVEKRCTGGVWDFLHSNALDRFENGDYLLSTRHSDTIYKISGDDGSILWRLHGHGGERSDFDMGNLNFSRQHHARILEERDGHTIISLLDNCVGADPQPATSSWSRGLIVDLDESAMTADITHSYDHPHGGKSFRRGSCQVMENKHVWMGWSEQALQSEHKEDGTLILEAEMLERKLGTYRTFKFEFEADPDSPPDLYSNASSNGNLTTTSVYASWNGATKVSSWALFKTDKKGSRKSELNLVPRSGFETAIEHDGYAKYVYVEARDKNNRPLGKSKILETKSTGKLSEDALQKETLWLKGEGGSGFNEWKDSMLGNPTSTFIGGIACGIFIALAGVFCTRRGGVRLRRTQAWPLYKQVSAGEASEYDETRLHDLSSSSYRDRGNGSLFKRPGADDDSDGP